MLTIVYQFQIGHVKLSEKPIIKLDQIIDDANDTIYLFITDSSGKQWRQLLEQKSSGKNISIKSKLFQDATHCIIILTYRSKIAIEYSEG